MSELHFYDILLSSKAIDRLYFKDVFREAGLHGLLEIEEVERWLEYRDNRNNTTHDYGEGLANETIKKPSEIIAFGSRVSGDSHDTSDLDLVIVSKEQDKFDIDMLMEFKEKIQQSNIPIIVQVLDWYRIPKNFHKNILLNSELLVEI